MSSASAICEPMRQRRRPSGSGPFVEPLGQRLALEQLHDEKVGRAVAADVVERADVRMVERGDGPRLALEARAPGPDPRRDAAGRTLTATSRSSRVSRAR